MICYFDGHEAKVGDHVDYDGEQSVVEVVIDSNDELKFWGLEERGLMLTNRQFGRVFQPVDSVVWEAVTFLRRGE